MTTVNLDKPLKARYEIEGVANTFEKMVASEILFNTYDIAAKIVNNGGVDWFNQMWKTIHPDWIYTGDSEDDYTKSYEKLFKYIADEVSEAARVNGLTYKLREHEPCLINFAEGYFTIYGYKDKK